ncbi:ABC transporter ATP-binding protein [Mycobacterium sp. ITM-2016-00317]|uniref:ABC transporter ATP-binding protein n=1 Tax=Mycobacterium sp. ITM-2016-00317 TaxID=2099694 RepID=UPI00287F42F3|nr:ABC transporter ATP-binding protein [Mycobacterium sp. ITM-2016-00317]WNG89157.1 ABC transporter ATP-binding protein [Mycobacterium sp. ITM-2016-00317]
MNAARLEITDLCVIRGARRVLDRVCLTAHPGAVIGVVGPNGCGKSTLLQAVLRILSPASGSITIDGVSVTSMRPRQLARTAAAVLQDATGDFDLQVRDVVAMGRAPHKRRFQGDSAADDAVIAESLALVGAVDLTDRAFALLSGGERQRVLVARALAQQPRLLVMDEPTNHLDVRHQFDVLALPARLGVTAVIALHDLNLAAHYCDEVVVLRDGIQVCAGPPEGVLTAELIAEVWGVTAAVGPHPQTGRPHVTFDPSCGADRLVATQW